tara:strand:- start:356 stop:631 length:276 start_codon:yes stop_codon:yes gene_type:complete
MDGFTEYALREQLIVLSELIKVNKDDFTTIQTLEGFYTAISFCLESIKKVESAVLDAQIINDKLKIQIRDQKRTIKELNKKIEDLLTRIEL